MVKCNIYMIVKLKKIFTKNILTIYLCLASLSDLGPVIVAFVVVFVFNVPPTAKVIWRPAMA